MSGCTESIQLEVNSNYLVFTLKTIFKPILTIHSSDRCLSRISEHHGRLVKLFSSHDYFLCKKKKTKYI